MWVVIIVYATVIVAAMAAVLSRDEVVLVSGSSLRALNGLFFVVTGSMIVLLHERTVQAFTMAAVSLIGLLLSLGLGETWLLLRYDADRTSKVIEESLSRILMDFRRSEEGYLLTLRDGKEARIRIITLPLDSAALSFHGQSGQKKLEVLRNLIQKRLAPLFPRPVIHL
jgi:hypothetical protein